MVIDLQRFSGVFFAESLEQLDAMEAILLRTDGDRGDRESIDTIFRAAHSIKGGSATFGFTDIAALTHALETLLDQVRIGERSLEQGLVDLLLESVDCLRELLHGYRDGKPVAGGAPNGLQDRIEALTGVDAGAGEGARSAAGWRAWQLRFEPRPQMLARGNDPYRLIRELADLGTLEVEADLTGLPPLKEMDPEISYLNWTLRLQGEVSRQQIRELFSWVEDDCRLQIHAVDDTPAVAAMSAAAGLGITTGGAATIRVNIDKIDQLINLVGELVITESMLTRLLVRGPANDFDPLQNASQQLSRNVQELQDSVLRMRMLPISFCFSRLPRIVRDLGQEFGKNIVLEVAGENTEVDKTILEKLTDPLTHLVRNAMDHGIEPRRDRLAAGKPERATVTVSASHQGGNVMVQVGDDGRGLDTETILRTARARGMVDAKAALSPEQIHQLIFLPGFSTADAVTDVSGRGVGLDVVRRNITELGGQVTLRSERGQGTTMTITLPLTLAIIDAQVLRIGGNTLVLPLLSVVENVHVRVGEFESVAGERVLYRFRDSLVPVLDLDRAWDLGSDQTDADQRLMVILEAASRRFGLLVDELLDQAQVVIKPLDTNFRPVKGLAGATILGDGTIALILDAAALAGMLRDGGHHRTSGAPPPADQPHA